MLWVRLPYATFGLDLTDGVVTRTPPIARFVLGWPADRAKAYYRSKGAKVIMLAI